MTLRRVVGFALGLSLLAGAGRVCAQSPVPEPQAQSVSTLDADQAFAVAIQLFTRNGEYEKALLLLMSRPDICNRPDGLRLRVELLLRLGRASEALSVIELYLSAHPDDALARFQLGEVRFSLRQDQAAAFAYRLALAGDLDDLRRNMALKRLDMIVARKRWRFWVGGAISPDSNLNSSTDSTTVDLFGLPFRLDEAARRRSGIGFTAYGGLERDIRLKPNLSVRARVAANVIDAPGNQTDLLSLQWRIGPQWRTGPQSTVSLQALASQSWFGGDLFEKRAGLRFETESYGQNRRHGLGLSAERIDSRLNPARDGESYSAEWSRTRYLGTSSLWNLSLAGVRREAAAASEAYSQAQVTAGRLYRAPFASFVYVELGMVGRRYDQAAASFGVRREDTEGTLGVRLSKRDLLIFGTHPYVAVQASRNRSNISLYAYHRERIEFGITREF